jgi:hypothetical protein
MHWHGDEVAPEPLVVALDEGVLDPDDDVLAGLPLEAVQDVQRLQDGLQL